MIVPWKEVHWSTSVSTDQCLERLRASAGVVSRSDGGQDALFVTTVGRTVILSLGASHPLASRPYLHAVVTRLGEGSVIQGRFNPDPVVTTSLVTLLLCLTLIAVAGATVGVEAVARFASYWFGSILRLGAALAVGALIVAGVLRARHWSRQCRAIEAILEAACQATTLPAANRTR